MMADSKEAKKSPQVSSFSLAMITGSTTDCLAKWKWSKGHVDHFDVVWAYWNTSKNGWVEGGTANVSPVTVGGYYQYTYFVPSGYSATKTRVSVKPISKKDKTVKYKEKGKTKTKKTTWFTAAARWSNTLTLPSAIAVPDVPGAPDLRINSADQVVLSWNYTDEKATHVIVYKKTDSGNWAQKTAIARTSNGVYSYTDTDTARGHTYQYRLYGKNNTSGKASQGSEVATIQNKAGALTKLEVSLSSVDTQDNNAAVNLKWKDSGTVRGTIEVEYATYNVWGTGAVDRHMVEFSKNPGSDGYTTVTVTGLERGKKWYFRVRRHTTGGYSAWATLASDATSTIAVINLAAAAVPAYDLGRPTALKAEDKTTEGSDEGRARLTWLGTFIAGDTYQIQWTELTDNFADNAMGAIESASLAFEDSSGGTCAYTVTGLEMGRTWYFRVRRTNDHGNSNWATCSSGAWRESDSVARVTFPVAPEAVPEEHLTAPTAVTTPMSCTAGDAVMLAWTHNSEEGTTQTAYQIELTNTYEGTTTTTTVDGGADGAYALETEYPDGTALTWRVRTQGADPDAWSPWSRIQTISVWSAPITSLELDGLTDETLTSYPLTITAESDGVSTLNQPISWWTSIESVDAYTAIGQDGEDLEIAAGDVMWSYAIDASDSSFSASSMVVVVDGSMVALAAGQSYRVRAGCTTAQGLRAEATPVEFDVEWSGAVPEPLATLVFDADDYCCRIWPACYDLDETTGEATDTLTDGVTLAVWRIESDGSTVLIARGIENDGESFVIDPHPMFGLQWYRVVATATATSLQASLDQEVECDVPYVVIQWDESWAMPNGTEAGEGADTDSDNADADVTYTGRIIELPYNLQMDEDHDPDVALHAYAGRRNPVSKYGTQRGESMTVSTGLIRGEDDDKIRLIRELQGARTDCYVRDPTGNTWWANVKARISQSYDSNEVSVTLTVTRVESPGGEEAVNVA